ncbi:hypothetical protein SERLADRAFT_391458 [Serpula lacrymans var. lacrymans S7.9]|nr:uncharacterized protein SERLADRAFT_391458 [Serpula lacrymans var. lacrymans S7.9]EGO23464.1 hypothetical protein SERLADRAFT_391458 [Serpula lacrymans var. lacrymans S7.9]
MWQAPGGCTAQLERQLIEDRLERARIEVQLYSQAIANADELPRLMFVDTERHSTDIQMSVDDPSSPLSMSPDPEFEHMSDLDQTSMSSVDSIGLPMLSTLDNITMPTFPPVMDTFGSEISMPDIISPCRREFGPVPESEMSSVVS